MIQIDDLQTLRDRENARHSETLAALDVVETLALSASSSIAFTQVDLAVSATAKDLLTAPPPLGRRGPSRKVRQVMKALKRRDTAKEGASGLPQRILAAVGIRGAASPLAISKALGKPRSVIKYHLKQLFASGQLTATGNRRSRVYRLAGSRAEKAAGQSGGKRHSGVQEAVLQWARGQDQAFTVVEAAKATRLKRIQCAQALSAGVTRGEVEHVRRGVYCRVSKAPPKLTHPLSEPGSFAMPRQKPSHLQQAVRTALEQLPELWNREALEAALPLEMRVLGRKDGALAAVLTELREHGVIELAQRDGNGLATYRTGQPKG